MKRSLRKARMKQNHEYIDSRCKSQFTNITLFYIIHWQGGVHRESRSILFRVHRWLQSWVEHQQEYHLRTISPVLLSDYVKMFRNLKTLLCWYLEIFSYFIDISTANCIRFHLPFVSLRLHLFVSYLYASITWCRSNTFLTKPKNRGYLNISYTSAKPEN